MQLSERIYSNYEEALKTNEWPTKNTSLGHLVSLQLISERYFLIQNIAHSTHCKSFIFILPQIISRCLGQQNRHIYKIGLLTERQTAA
jgi:hypothetical protein